MSLQNQEESFQSLEALAQLGDARSQYALGSCYRDGEDTNPDPQQAFRWFKAAANQNYLDAQYQVAMCYEGGYGIAKDSSQSFLWSKKAADLGHVAAQHQVGMCYRQGVGIGKDAKQAFAWLRKAALQEDELAQYELGICYRDGEGTDRNLEEAFQSFKAAANQNYLDAQYEVAMCYRGGYGIAKDPSQAFTWCKRAADLQLPKAQYLMGMFYRDGFGTPKDPEQAFKWFKEAAQRNYIPAQHELSICYEQGIGTEKDSNAASMWLKQAILKQPYDRNRVQAPAKKDIKKQPKKLTPPTKTLPQKKPVQPPKQIDAAAISAKAELEEKNTRIKTNQQKDTIDKALIALEGNVETIEKFAELPQHQARIAQIMEDIKKLKNELSNFHNLSLDQASKDLAIIDKKLLALKESYHDCKNYAALYTQIIGLNNKSAEEGPALQQDINTAISLHTSQLQLQTKTDKKSEEAIRQKQNHLDNLYAQRKKLPDVRSAHEELQKKITGLDSLGLKERITQVQDLHRALLARKEEWVRYNSETRGLVWVGISPSEFEQEKVKLQKAASTVVQPVPPAKAKTKKAKAPKTATNSTALITGVFAAAHTSSASSSPALTASSASTFMSTQLVESVSAIPSSSSEALTAGSSSIALSVLPSPTLTAPSLVPVLLQSASSMPSAYGVDSVWAISTHPGKNTDIKQVKALASVSVSFFPSQKHDIKKTKEGHRAIINLATKFNQLCQQNDLSSENPLVVKLAQEGAMFFFAQACLDTNKFREKTTSRKNLTALRDNLVHNRPLWNSKTSAEVNSVYQTFMQTLAYSDKDGEPFGTEFLSAFAIPLPQFKKHLSDTSLDIDTLTTDFARYESNTSTYSAANQLVWECANQFLHALPDFKQQLSNAAVGDSITGSIKKQGNKARHGQEGLQFLKELIDRLDKLVVARGVPPTGSI